MSRKEKTVIGCILVVIAGALSELARVVIVFYAILPVGFPMFLIVASGHYMDGYEVTYEYMGEARLDTDRTAGAEWEKVLYGDIYKKQWAFIVDSEEEFEQIYGKYGVPDDLLSQFDYENNILVISINRHVNSIKLLEKGTVWQDGVPYAFPDFTFEGKFDNNQLYFYRVPRIELTYLNCDKEKVVSKLNMWKVAYADRGQEVNGNIQTHHTEYFPFFPKWSWAWEKLFAEG